MRLQSEPRAYQLPSIMIMAVGSLYSRKSQVWQPHQDWTSLQTNEMIAGHLRQVIIAGRAGSPDTEALMDAAHASFTPDKAVMQIDTTDEGSTSFWQEHNPEALAMARGVAAAPSPLPADLIFFPMTDHAYDILYRCSLSDGAKLILSGEDSAAWHGEVHQFVSRCVSALRCMNQFKAKGCGCTGI